MKISSVVKTKTKEYVWIDTCQLTNQLGNMIDTIGIGNSGAIVFEYETMVFPGNKKGEVKDWGDLDHKNYSTEEKAKVGHKEMIKRWQKK